MINYLYEITYGATTWLHTSNEDQVVIGAATYTPAIITNSEPNATQELRQQQIELLVPRDFAPAVQLFRNGYPAGAVWIVMKVQVDGGVPLAYFSGRIRSCIWAESEASMTCSPITDVLQRTGLRVAFQPGCNNTLYDGKCGVNKALHMVSGTLGGTTEGGAQISTMAVNGSPLQHFRGGWLEAGGQRRLVIWHEADSVKLLSPIAGLVIGGPVSVYAGCDGLKTTCKDKYANVRKFGGFPWIPIVNPFETGIF